MSAWQSMETAPRDNEHVLLLTRNARASSRRKPPQVVGHSRDGVSWWSVPGFYQIYPTHWMPLPDPPSPGEEPTA